MTPVKQTLFGGPEGPVEEIGNCYPACIASIFMCPLEKVPHFYQLERDNDRASALILSWFHSFGYCPICYEYADWIQKWFPSIIGIIYGKSPRGDFSHAVVGKITKDGWELLHDPHPSNAGIVGEPTHFEVFLPLQMIKE